MDLSYGNEYDELRAQVCSFLEENWPPQGAASREAGAHQFRQAAIDAGYIYRNIPKRYGGSEQKPDSIAAQIIREEFGAKHAPMEIRGIGMMMRRVRPLVFVSRV